jgi:hypothetical protein
MRHPGPGVYYRVYKLLANTNSLLLRCKVLNCKWTKHQSSAPSYKVQSWKKVMANEM